MTARQVLPGIVLLLGLSSSALAQEVRTTRTYDLRFLVRNVALAEPVQRSLPDENSAEQYPPAGFRDDGAPAIDLDGLSRLLHDGAGIGGDDDFATSPPGLITVTCAPGKHDKIAAWIELCRQVYLEQVTVELHMLPNKALAAGRGTLTREEADALLRSVGPHPCFVTAAQVGSRALLQTNQTTAYVRDYDVEVAQSSTLPDPKVDVMAGGSGWTVATSRGASGKLVVTVSGQQVVPVGPPTLHGVPTSDARGAVQVAQLQLPRIRFDSMSSEAQLADGEAMLFGVGDAESEVQCLRIRRPHAIPLPSGPDWSWVAVGDLTARPRPPAFAHIRARRPGDDAPLFLDSEEAPPPRVMDESQLLQRLRHGMRIDDGGDTVAFLPGNLASIRCTTPERWQAVRDTVAELTGSMVRQLTVEIRHGRLDAATANGLVDGRVDVGEAAGKLGVTCVSPCLLHGWFGMCHAIQQAYITDYEVEIAQDASVPNPIVHNQLAGTSMRGQVLLATRGHYQLALRVSFVEFVGEIENFDLKDERFGLVGLPKLRDIQIDVSPIVEVDRWTLLHLAPLHGTTEHLAVVARVRG